MSKPPIIDASLKQRLGLLDDQGGFHFDAQDISVTSAIAACRSEYATARKEFDLMQKEKATKSQFGRLFTHAPKQPAADASPTLTDGKKPSKPNRTP